MDRRDVLKGLAAASLAGAQEKKSPTEALDLQRKIENTVTGKRAIDPMSYPYFSPDYKMPFAHVGTEKQLFLDNYMLDELQGAERIIVKP